jgi:hypothetical protein
LQDQSSKVNEKQGISSIWRHQMAAVNTIRAHADRVMCSRISAMQSHLPTQITADTVYQVATVAAVLLLLGSFAAL